ncbi:MAG: tryptophan-rich sensory protein [Beijerinckiaceae bacterium]|nr:tryptophan-rich sensory protein [Beijerinckiaceae bacterium]
MSDEAKAGASMSPAGFMTRLGGLKSDAGPWFEALVKPAWQPPRALFGPVWGVLVLSNITSLAIGLQAADDPTTIALLAAGNAACGLAWTPLFFRLRRPDRALVVACLLIALASAYVAALFPISIMASLLALPYAVWVTFAGVLNWQIVRLNGPFH